MSDDIWLRVFQVMNRDSEYGRCVRWQGARGLLLKFYENKHTSFFTASVPRIITRVRHTLVSHPNPLRLIYKLTHTIKQKAPGLGVNKILSCES